MNRIQQCISMAFVLATASLLAGCASTSTSFGNKIDPDKVAQIKKGVTTRAEVEALLGPPTNVSIAGDGRRMMFYSFHEASATGHATAGSYIPIVGPFTGGGRATGQAKNQRLQILLTKADIVEDYEFTDSTSQTQHSSGFGTSTTTTTVAPEKK